MRLGDRTSEQARRVAAGLTREILLRRGSRLGMVVGVGYPKSGTVWLCQMAAAYLDVPYPREYELPVAMRAVIHAHWRYDDRIPQALYIRRDGRDVMVSLYFYYIRALDLPVKPARARRLQEMFRRLYGRSFDPADVRANLPRFIETQLSEPKGSAGLAWHEHLDDWASRNGVHHTSYERLRREPAAELDRVMTNLTGVSNPDLARLAAERYSFERVSGRIVGDEDRTSFQRKGIAGDWANHFSKEAGEVFDQIAGRALLDFGYVQTRDWWKALDA